MTTKTKIPSLNWALSKWTPSVGWLSCDGQMFIAGDYTVIHHRGAMDTQVYWQGKEIGWVRGMSTAKKLAERHAFEEEQKRAMTSLNVE